MPNFNISLPDIRKQQKFFASINKFGKGELISVLKPLLNFLKPHTLIFSKESDPTLVTTLKLMLARPLTSFLKNEIVSIVTSWLLPDENVINVAKADKGVKALILALIYNGEMSYNDAKTILKQPLTFETTSSGWSSLIIGDLRLGLLDVSCHGYYRRQGSKEWYDSLEISLPPSLRSSYALELIDRTEIDALTSEKLPEGVVLQNFESEISTDLLFLEGMNSAGSLPEKYASITGTVLKKNASKLPGGDFNPPFSQVPRKELLIFTYIKYLHYSNNAKQASSVTNFVKFIVQNLPNQIGGTNFSLLLPNFNGFTTAWAEVSNADTVTNYLYSLIKNAAGKEWLDMQNFITRYKLLDKATNNESGNYTHLFSYYARSRNKLKRRDSKNTSSIDWLSEVIIPFVVTWMELMCACGLLELAVDPKCEVGDPLCGIRYIRYTDAGLYAIGKKNTYNAPAQTMEKPTFELDDNGIVTIINRPCPFEAFLSKIGTSISASRYQITPQTIVRGSKTQAEVADNVERFKTLICPNPEGIWFDTLEETIIRAYSTMPLNEQYILVRFKPEVPGLIDFISTNRDIAEKCLKVEGYYLLVPHDFLDKLKALCLKAGYII